MEAVERFLSVRRNLVGLLVGLGLLGFTLAVVEGGTRGLVLALVAAGLCLGALILAHHWPSPVVVTAYGDVHHFKLSGVVS
jgi:hypothetical protein